MKVLNALISVMLFAFMVWFLNSPQTIGETSLPALGRFLDPFHGYLQNGDEGNHFLPGDLKLDGLNGSVQVFFDENSIPHIYAENLSDLYYVQGYLVASDRLWQMEFQTHAAAGRISELIGAQALSFDREQRRKGMVAGAKRSFEALSKDSASLAIMESFSRGVNHYIQSLEYDDLPVEYKLMGYKPEPWEPLKSALLIEYMIDQLIGSDRDIENTNALALLGLEEYQRLFPDHTPGEDPTIPTTQPWGFDPLTVQSDSIVYSASDYLRLKKLIESNPSNGSNNWAVSGRKAANGVPLLANDTHLGLNLPSLWYIMHLSAPGLNVAGFTIPGAPGIVIGYNEKIAWGFTNAPRDQRDWYRITISEDDTTKYFHDGQWKTFRYVTDTFQIKGGKVFIDQVKWTDLGPVKYDQLFQGKGKHNGLAFRWIGHEPSRLLTALSHLNRADSYEEYQMALQYWDAPSQNVVFASNNGDIAMRIEGTFPLKWKDQGKFILDASRPLHDWQGYIPHEQNAFMLNPTRGFVSSANQVSVDTLYPYWFYSSNSEAYRNRRINRVLDSDSSITFKDFRDLHMDIYSILAEETVPFLLKEAEKVGIPESSAAYVKLLKEWNFTYDGKSEAPSYFEALWGGFLGLLWDEFRMEGIPMRIPDDFHTTYLMKSGLLGQYIQNKGTPETDSLSSLIVKSMIGANEQMNLWKDELGGAEWYRVNKVKLNHLARLAPFGTDVLEVSGSGDTPNALKGSHGPSQRIIVEMSVPPTAKVALPGGQSGNPGSSRYLNMLENYIQGEYIPLELISKERANSENKGFIITLEKQ